MKESTRVPTIEETEKAKRSHFCEYFRPNDRFAQIYNRYTGQEPVTPEDIEDIPELEKELLEKCPREAKGGILKNLKGRGPVFLYPHFDETVDFLDTTKLPLSITPFPVVFARDRKALLDRQCDYLAKHVEIAKDEEDPEKLNIRWGDMQFSVRVKVMPQV